MIEVDSKKLDSEDCEVLSNITKSATKGTPLDSNRSVEDITKEIERISADDKFQLLSASDEKGELRGWTCYYIAFPLMAFINGFYPIVDMRGDYEQVALSLIEASKSNIVKLRKHSRLEIELEFPTKAHRDYSKMLVEWYTECGFKFAAEEIHMRSNLIAIELPEYDLPQGYKLRRFSGVPCNMIEGPGRRTLENSKEGLFLSMSHAEQTITLEYFFDKSKPYIDDASLLLERDGEIVGFVITRVNDDEPEIGPVGLVPEVRGQGLASYLLVRVLKNLKSSGSTSVCLDTTITNFPAQKLYRKYGFEDVYHKQFYYWSP